MGGVREAAFSEMIARVCIGHFLTLTAKAFKLKVPGWCRPLKPEVIVMRPLFLSRLAVALPLAGMLLSPVQVQAQKMDRVKFETYDGVELHGTFYPSNKGQKAVTVLLLHKINGKSAQDGWDRLAKALQKEDFAVLSFDFRGHGDSTNIAQPKVFRSGATWG